jgi:phage shock protein E
MDIWKNLFSSHQIGADALAAIQQGACIVDVRMPEEYALGHVPGSINLPLDWISFQWEQLKDKEPLVLCCRTGHRSGQAKLFLEQLGFHQVTNGGSWEDVSHALKTLQDNDI